MDIICFSAVNWDPLMTRIQNLMLRVPKHHRVFYIEPQSTLISPLKDKKRWKDYIMWINNPVKIINENIYVLKFPPVLPFYNKNYKINKINQYYTAKYLKQIFRKYNINDPIIWVYNPNYVDLITYINPSYVVYDCVDKHSEFKGFINKEVVETYEKRLCQISDIVFATAENLYDHVRKYNPNTFLIPNGVDFDLFNTADTINYVKPEEMKKIKGKVLGFIGAIEEWIDLELIYNVAKAKPEWNFVLIGPQGNNNTIPKLKEQNNVYFISPKPQKLLPQYIKYFDVCLNLFKKSELTKNVSPLKFYEYLATGKPIISTDMPHIRKYQNVVSIVEDSNDFISKCEKILGDNADSNKIIRIKIAKEASWDNRMKEIIQKLNDVCGLNLEKEGGVIEN